jgi:type III secretion protein L
LALAYLVDGSRFKLAVERGIVKSDAFEALQDASALLARCQSLWERLQADLQQAQALERQRGFEQGMREGQSQCAIRLTQIEAEAARYLGALDDKVVTLIMDVVRKIAPRLGASELVPDLVEQAIKEVRAERFLRVRVHPDCRTNVMRRLDEIGKAHAPIEFIEVLADPQVEPFACTLESEVGIVRADLEVQLQAIERAMCQSVEREKGRG